MKCAYLIVLMATYWMTEAMPLPITSMIPMVTFKMVFRSYRSFKGGPPSSGSDVNRRSGGQLSQRHQLHGQFSPLDHFLYLAPSPVPGRLDHGHCGGALRVAQQGGLEDHHDGGLLPGQTDARLHVHHHVPLHVDLQHCHHSHDASHRLANFQPPQSKHQMSIAVDAVAMAISEPDPPVPDDAESLHESEAVGQYFLSSHNCTLAQIKWQTHGQISND